MNNKFSETIYCKSIIKSIFILNCIATCKLAYIVQVIESKLSCLKVDRKSSSFLCNQNDLAT